MSAEENPKAIDCPGCDRLFRAEMKVSNTEQNITYFRGEMDRVIKTQQTFNEHITATLDAIREKWAADMLAITHSISKTMDTMRKTENRIVVAALSTLVGAGITVATAIVINALVK